MPGIANLDVKEFQNRILRFDESYVTDWQSWVNGRNNQREVASSFGRVLTRWQACRPNRMRRARIEARHDQPYLEDLIAESNWHVQELEDFDIRHLASFTQNARKSLEQLWGVFQGLSYHGRARNGLAGVVGISNAVLLLTEGRIGPAFDSEVRKQLKIKTPGNALEWIDALRAVSRDIHAFETTNQCSLQKAAPNRFAGMHSGRIYDMALGPGGKAT